MTRVITIAHSAEHNRALVARFMANSLGYEGAPFQGLLSPSSSLIPESTANRLSDDAQAVDQWYEGMLDLYCDILAGGKTDTLQGLLEFGLSAHARDLQRASAQRRDRPRAGRLDCVDLGSDNFVAEVQWKGAGEGWLAAIDRSYREVFPMAEGQRGIGDLVQGWAQHFAGPGCAVNTGRTGWMDTERFLIRELSAVGTALVSCPFDNIQQVLSLEEGVPSVRRNGASVPVHHLWLDRLTEVMDTDFLNRLVKSYLAGQVLIDPPPSYLFNQKLPLALPFTNGYRNYFPDAVRRVIIPSVMVTQVPDLTVLVPYLDHDDASRVTTLRSWDDLYELPCDIRARLVLKCGSADQFDNHGGHGVFRLGGPAAAARHTLDSVLARVVSGEPWIMQPFLGHTWPVPVTTMDRLDEVVDTPLHAKFGIYFRLPREPGPKPEVLGGVASMGTTWKVSGASKTPATVDATGRLSGAFRHDIRVAIGL